MKALVRPGSRLLAMAAFVSATAWAQTALDTPEQKAGYSIGANIGFNLAAQGLAQDLDIEALLAGVRDGANGQLQLSEEEIMLVLQTFAMEQQAKMMAAQEAEAQAGRDFLAGNGSKSGVMTTVSGLQYEVLTASSDAGAAKPTLDDTVEVHYHGTLIDGRVFDSSVERGESITFPLAGVIPGWTEGLQLMKVGDKFRFFIPPDLAYGPNPVGDIPGNSVLIFDVELLAIVGAGQ
jgi:FKBP-type peptidyl-prolyl cis-trans isomerase FklB